MNIEARIVGLTALLEKERTVGAKTQGLLTSRLEAVGDVVRDDTRHRYVDYSARGAEGVQTKVLTSGLWVVQTIRKSRNILMRRPNFGPLMMRKAFLPAAREHEDTVLTAASAAVKEATAYWNS